MPTDNGHCQGFRKDGSPCQSPATSAGGWCFWHDPQRPQAEKHAAAQRGGFVMRQRQALPAVADVRMRSPESCLQLLEQTVEEMKTGKLDTRTGNAVSYAIGVACKIWEVLLSDRIDKLERLIHGRVRQR